MAAYMSEDFPQRRCDSPICVSPTLRHTGQVVPSHSRARSTRTSPLLYTSTYKNSTTLNRSCTSSGGNTIRGCANCPSTRKTTPNCSIERHVPTPQLLPRRGWRIGTSAGARWRTLGQILSPPCRSTAPPRRADSESGSSIPRAGRVCCGETCG